MFLSWQGALLVAYRAVVVGVVAFGVVDVRVDVIDVVVIFLVVCVVIASTSTSI